MQSQIHKLCGITLAQVVAYSCIVIVLASCVGSDGNLCVESEENSNNLALDTSNSFFLPLLVPIPVGECEPDPEPDREPEKPQSQFALDVDNSSDSFVSIQFAFQYYSLDGKADSPDFNGLARRYAAKTKQRTSKLKLINAYAYANHGLPTKNRMVYPLFLLTFGSAGQSRHYLALGGSKEDYETYVRDQLTLPAGTEVLGYGYLYTPGETVREELGLPVNNSQGTAIYTDLDPKRKAYSASGFVLKLKIEGDNSSDIHWDFSGNQGSTQATSMQGYLGTGSSGSSEPLEQKKK